jgi:asparagine synthase (glutamine-hydrolysing)
LDFVRHLRGEFAIVLFDEEQQLLVALRDRYGIKPLFWTVQDNKLLVASEVKAFLPLGWNNREWDLRALMDGGWSNDERTVFKGIYKVS